jgi:hypothetical protein
MRLKTRHLTDLMASMRSRSPTELLASGVSATASSIVAGARLNNVVGMESSAGERPAPAQPGP